ncbi:MAG: HYR domain-containing protein [Saprospiraceae bacterium]
MFPFEKIYALSSSRLGTYRLLIILAAFVAFLSNNGQAQTCTFTQKIISSQDPFKNCPTNTRIILIKDTLEINGDFKVDPGGSGNPFDGLLIVDGGVLLWSTAKADLKMGDKGRILLYNGGYIYPKNLQNPNCNKDKTISFGGIKVVSCKLQDTIFHSFADVNAAGCVDGAGICCDVALTVKENSGIANDLTLCEPGDTVELSALGSGTLDYFAYNWNPNIGNGKGPYKVAQFVNTTYSIGILAQFDPEGPEPPYILGCGASATVKINPQINLITTVTPVPCASSAVGTINLTVSGGTAPYKYLWSNTKTTEDINGLVGGTYTVTVTDAKGCSEVKSATVFTLDNIPPTLSCPGSASGIAAANLCTTTISGIDAVFSDNCPSAQLSYVVTGATTANGNGQLSNTLPFQVGVSNVKYQVNDGSNTVSCFFTVTVSDNQFPTASNPPTMTGIQCFANIPPSNPAVVTDEADNCGTPNVVFLSQSIIGGTSCPGDPLILSRRYRVIDASGNGIAVTQLIHVADTQSPTFTQVPANVTANCQSIPPVGSPLALDNCTETVNISYLGETRTNGACPNSYTLTRTWRAQDDCGNSTSTSQVITVQDITSPVFSVVPPNVTVNCQAVPVPGNATATDNCDASVTISYLGETRTDGSCPGAYSLRRIWKAEDDCGNTSTAQQIITVQDLTSPILAAVPADVTVSCESVPIPGTPTATDNCDPSVSITYLGELRTNGPCLDTYSLLRSWKAEDDCGNTATATQRVTVRDQTLPTFNTVPGNVTVACDSIPSVGAPTASDNCDSDVTISYTGETRTNGACQYSYTLTRQWTASDNCGNTKTAVQTITVQDLKKPVFTFVPLNITVSCDALPPLGLPTASDNCDPSVSINYLGEIRENGVCLNTYLLRRQWRATDQCGNVATAEQVITVQDLTPPVYTFIPDQVTVNCNEIPNVGTPSAIDNCDASVSIVYDGETRVNGNCPNNYLLNRRWTATDNCGNTTVATQVITVQDVTAPAFTSVPAGVTTSCESLPPVGIPQATDLCAALVLITYLGESVPGGGGACPGNYNIIRTWSAQDACGNSTTATQTITVQDITPPVVLTVPADAVVSCANIPPVESPTAFDNCDSSPTITYSGATQISGSCPNNYILKRQWVISDDCGNTSTAVQTLTVQDVTAPSFTQVPPAVTVSCDLIPPVGTPAAIDNCAANVSIAYNGVSRQDGSCPDSYTLTRSWTATDACGNSSVTSQIITVQDLTPPVFSAVPPPITVSCDAVPPVGSPAATDNCDATVTLQYTGQQRFDGNCPYNYTLQRTWRATDNCGNTSLATQLITVQDLSAPTYTFVPVSITVSCEAVPPVGTPTATDNCSANVIISYLGQARTNGACTSSYSLIRTWSAQDACGNSTTATQKITVQDNTKPVVNSVPPNVTVSCSAIPPVGTPTATDNCDQDLTITYNGATRTNGGCPNSYTLKRQWTISDDCGNTSTAAQTITVQDVTAPAFTFIPPAATVSCEAIPPVQSPVAMDDCASNVTIIYNGEVRTNGSCPDSYTLKRSWIARDSCFNISTAEQIITVQDVTPPNFTLIPVDVVVNCDNIPPVAFPTAIDNCDAFVNISYSGQTRVDGNCPQTYSLRREWVATDNCSNTSKATQVITVQDITAPTFTFVPPNITVNCQSVPPVVTPQATDNCDANVEITFSGEVTTPGTCPNTYLLKRTWTAKDDCGNTKTALQTITVQDIIRPVFTFVPQDSMVNCDAVPPPGMPIATDNCTINPSIVFDGESIMSSTSPDAYILKRVWTAKDDCGNTSTAAQILTVQDTIAPTILCPNSMTLEADAATCTGIAIFNQPLSSDNCSATLNISSTMPSGHAFPVGITPVTFTVKDTTGNLSTCTFNVTVLDKTVPSLVDCPSDFTVTTDPANCEAIVSWTSPSVIDPCGQSTIVLTPTIPSDTTLQTGIYPVTYTAVDSSGNSTQCSFVVTVREDVPPVLIDCPLDISVNTETCTAKVDWIAPSATDNCASQVTITPSIPSGSIFQETSTVVEYTATDNWGNTATCSFTVTVIDIVEPVFDGCPGDMLVDVNLCKVPVTWVQPTATDNCNANPTIYSEPAPGESFSAGFTTVHVYVVDPSGNRDTCTFVVEVTAPAIGLSDVPVNQSFIGCDAIATWSPPKPTGLCNDEFTLTSNYPPDTTFSIGETEVIYTLKDTLGQIVTASFIISVTESGLPQFDCPASTIQVNISGAISTDPLNFLTATDTISTCDGVELEFQHPNATDNCFPPEVTQVGGQASGSVFNLGMHTLTYQAKDAAGNTKLCAVQIQVLPLLPLNPLVSDAIACKGDEVTLSATPVNGAIYHWTGPNPPYPDNNNLVILDIDSTLTGYYTVEANVNGCITPLDSARVRIGKLPDAVDDVFYQVATNEILSDFNVLLNDIYEPDDYTLTITTQHPGLIDHGNGLYSFQAGNKNTVVYLFYTICSKACPNLCDEGIIAITVRERICSYIPNIITPNGDDSNDFLTIPCLDIESYPQNHLVIYNQWGDKVYEAQPYLNDPVNAWKGEYNGQAGKGLPDATYYYIFKAMPDDKGLRGFIEIFR